MKKHLVISFCVLSLTSFGQSRVFVEKASMAVQAKDSTIEIDLIEPKGEEYDFLSSGSEDLENLFLSALKSSSRAKPDELKQSATLVTLANLATEAWRGSHYSDSKKWRNLSKYFRRAAQKSTSRFNLMKEVSFRIPLINNHGKRFYYDRKGTLAEHNLYSGKKPRLRLDEDDEDYVEPVPLDYFTEKELVDKFLREVRRKSLSGELKRGLYAYAGVSVEIDERTIHKNRIPTARVVVVLGARRLQRVRVKKPENKAI